MAEAARRSDALSAKRRTSLADWAEKQGSKQPRLPVSIVTSISTPPPAQDHKDLLSIQYNALLNSESVCAEVDQNCRSSSLGLYTSPARRASFLGVRLYNAAPARTKVALQAASLLAVALCLGAFWHREAAGAGEIINYSYL